MSRRQYFCLTSYCENNAQSVVCVNGWYGVPGIVRAYQRRSRLGLYFTANMIGSQTTKTRWKVAWHNMFLRLQSACNGCDIAELITLKYSTFRIKTE